MDQILDHIPTSMWQEYKNDIHAYIINKELLDLYQRLRYILGEKLMRANVQNMDVERFTEELNHAAEFERNLMATTKRQRAEWINKFKLYFLLAYWTLCAAICVHLNLDYLRILCVAICVYLILNYLNFR